MPQSPDYTGFYYMMGFALQVMQTKRGLIAAVPDVPTGFEITMEALGDHQFRLNGGPLDGGVVKFILSGEGVITAIQAGGFKLAKAPPEKVRDLPLVERFVPPSLDLTPDKKLAFQKLNQAILNKSDGGWVDYPLPYPKYEFVQYLTRLDQIIFHGSNNLEIELFSPQRKSIELRDDTGRGNLQAVYGTHEGLWAMFFAVVHRARLRGSIRNGVMYFHNQAGETLSVFNFSINREQLAEQPWTDGALYLLPRESFKRLKLGPDAFSNEWASTSPVRPLAKLHVQPGDFPFLEKIGGHDDGELLRLETLGREIRAAAVRASLHGDLFHAVCPIEEESSIQEFVQLQQTVIPAAKFSIISSQREVTLEIRLIPPAYRDMLAAEYADLLSATSD